MGYFIVTGYIVYFVSHVITHTWVDIFFTKMVCKMLKTNALGLLILLVLLIITFKNLYVCGVPLTGEI